MYVKRVTKLGILDKPNQGRMGHGYLTIYILCIYYLGTHNSIYLIRYKIIMFEFNVQVYTAIK